MNEIEALRWHLERYRAILSQQVDRLYNALEELQRTTLLRLKLDNDSDEKIDDWLQTEGFAVDEDGFFQSQPLLLAFRQGSSPDDAVSISWGKNLRSDPTVRRHIYSHRDIGDHLKQIHDRLENVGWIYYQDAANASLQYPFIDQRSAISYDFDWTMYPTFLSVCPQNNPQRQIRWTSPTVDYAGEGVILSVSIPVWRNDVFIGLWSIDLPVRYIYRDFGSSKSFSQQNQFIVDNKGMLVWHEKLQVDTEQTKGYLFHHSLTELGGQWQDVDLEVLTAEKKGQLNVKDAVGMEWEYCYCHVPGVDWLLFAGLPTTVMEKASAKRLKQAFRKISDGNLTHRIEVTSTNTLNMLIDEFNKMSERLSLTEQHRQEMEKQLYQAQKMEAVGRLAGGVAHDYNNMINVIMGYTEMALEKIERNDPLYFDLQEINTAAMRSKELTRQLLGFARCQPIAPKILDINKTVDNILKMLHHLIGEDIELVWYPGKQVWPIQIDPTQIDQILANLCVNARDAINGVGKIIIETANIEIDETYCSLHQGFIPGEFVQLSVTDNGVGMDSTILNNIFEPFFSTKAIGRGTGLGLATVFGIVKQNNGFINVYSETGRGTTFNIYLPRGIGTSIEVVSNSSMESSFGNNETLMLVEDENAILRLSEKMLKQLGYRVLGVNSPMEALSISRNHQEPIDLLITDVIMPDLNGHDLANRLRETFPELTVLFMSGYTSNVIIHRGVLDKDVFLLQKPFSKKELAAKVKEVLTATSGSMR